MSGLSQLPLRFLLADSGCKSNQRNIPVSLWVILRLLWIRAAVTANIPVTIDIRANGKDRVRVDVLWNQESVKDPRHCIGM